MSEHHERTGFDKMAIAIFAIGAIALLGVPLVFASFGETGNSAIAMIFGLVGLGLLVLFHAPLRARTRQMVTSRWWADRPALREAVAHSAIAVPFFFLVAVIGIIGGDKTGPRILGFIILSVIFSLGAYFWALLAPRLKATLSKRR